MKDLIVQYMSWIFFWTFFGCNFSFTNIFEHFFVLNRFVWIYSDTSSWMYRVQKLDEYSNILEYLYNFHYEYLIRLFFVSNFVCEYIRKFVCANIFIQIFVCLFVLKFAWMSHSALGILWYFLVLPGTFWYFEVHCGTSG